MAVSAHAFEDMRPVPERDVAQRHAETAPHSAADRWKLPPQRHLRAYFAITVSVLLHVWLLWRPDAVVVGTEADAPPTPLTVRIKTLTVTAPAPQAVPPKVQPPRAESVRTPSPPKPRPTPPSVKPVPPAATSTPPAPAVESAAAQPTAAPPAPASTTASAADNEPVFISEPRYRQPPSPPDYPPQAVRRSEEGTTLVRAQLSPVGDVVETRVHASSGSALLDKAALAAVRRWQFVPAVRDGRAVAAWVQVPVQFRLDE